MAKRHRFPALDLISLDGKMVVVPKCDIPLAREKPGILKYRKD